MTLINKIRSAQIAAGEEAVIANLERLGLGDPRKAKIIAMAREYCNDELEIDDEGVKVSEGDDNGAWVSAWVWVDFSGTELDKNVEEDETTEEHVGHLSPEELAEDRELVAAAMENREECKMNPLYTAYAWSHGMSAEEVLARDREQYPGGCMTGFILFVADMKRKFWEVCPEAFFCNRPESIVDVDAFYRFVAEQVK